MTRPDFISRRPLIQDFLLKDKREGRFVTAVAATAGATRRLARRLRHRLRLIWNLVTTVSFDYGISSEGQIFPMDLGYAF